MTSPHGKNHRRSDHTPQVKAKASKASKAIQHGFALRRMQHKRAQNNTNMEQHGCWFDVKKLCAKNFV
jgi:hypothetical protein